VALTDLQSEPGFDACRVGERGVKAVGRTNTSHYDAQGDAPELPPILRWTKR
jgi:hypothetical protein